MGRRFVVAAIAGAFLVAIIGLLGSPASWAAPPVPIGADNILINGDFSMGLTGWDLFLDPGCAGARSAEVIPVDTPHVDVLREESVGAGGCGGQSGVTQDLGLAAASLGSLSITADVKAISASVANGCGFGGHEYPINVRVRYTSSAGPHQVLVYGFYFGGGSCGNPGPFTGEIFETHEVVQNEWYEFESGNVLDLIPDAITIDRIEIVGAGWDYRGHADNIVVTTPPTTTTHAAIADTYLKQGHPNKNFGAETILRVRQSGKNRALIGFDQTAIEDAVGSGTLQSATLRLNIQFNANNWGNEGRLVGIHRMNDFWSELGATWKCGDDTDTSNQQPNCTQWKMGQTANWPFESSPTDEILHERDQLGWVEWDVTADVQAFLSDTAPNYGWIIKKVIEGQAGHVQYSSKEGGFPPELVIVVQ